MTDLRTAPVDEVARAIEDGLLQQYSDNPTWEDITEALEEVDTDSLAQAARRAVAKEMRAHAAAEQSANGDFIVKWIDAYAKECASGRGKMTERTLDAAELARLREKYDTDSQVDVEFRSLLDALEKARRDIASGQLYSSQAHTRIQELVAALAAARALLWEAAPHIERALVPYKDGWIEEKQDILKRIAAELGEG